MAKICFITGTLDVGGTEKQLLLLCRYINRKKFQVVVISLRGGRMKEEFQKENILVRVIGKRFRFDVIALFKLIMILLRERPDILHTLMFTSNTWGRVAGILTGTDVIIASERSIDLWKKKHHFFIDRLLGFFTDKIVCNSVSVQNRYKKNLGSVSRKIIVIRNGIELHKFNLCNGKKKERKEKIVFTASRLSPEKGVQFLIEAARIILKQDKGIKFLIAGEGHFESNLVEMVKEYGIKDNVIFLGYRNDIPQLISESDVVVLPSLWEGMPNILLEAMAMKKPVIATDVGGSSEIVKNGQTGLIVRPGSAADLAEKIMLLFSDKMLAEKIAENGYELARMDFGISSMVSSYETLYQHLLQRRK
ncbi:MAG: glycosyltransferase [Candidatus Omnitrophica bacterium]|nr:glycosyltransferase [Candidatus Omnitrophota bacterium]